MNPVQERPRRSWLSILPLMLLAGLLLFFYAGDLTDRLARQSAASGPSTCDAPWLNSGKAGGSAGGDQLASLARAYAEAYEPPSVTFPAPGTGAEYRLSCQSSDLWYRSNKKGSLPEYVGGREITFRAAFQSDPLALLGGRKGLSASVFNSPGLKRLKFLAPEFTPEQLKWLGFRCYPVCIAEFYVSGAGPGADFGGGRVLTGRLDAVVFIDPGAEELLYLMKGDKALVRHLREWAAKKPPG